MQQTTNYNLNVIERSDNILESVDALGQNAIDVDNILCKKTNINYETATASETAGYYYIKTTSAIINGLYKIHFPTITSTNNAYLSVDNGTNYYEVLWNGETNFNVKANYLSGQNIDLIFNGTNFIAQNIDTGWIAPIYESGYATNSTIKVRRVGNRVYFNGQVQKDSGNFPQNVSARVFYYDTLIFAPSNNYLSLQVGAGMTYAKVYIGFNTTNQWTTGNIVQFYLPNSTNYIGFSLNYIV